MHYRSIMGSASEQQQQYQYLFGRVHLWPARQNFSFPAKTFVRRNWYKKLTRGTKHTTHTRNRTNFLKADLNRAQQGDSSGGLHLSIAPVDVDMQYVG